MKQFIIKLKSATATLHKNLEASVLSKKIMSLEVNKTDYSNYLHASLQMHSDVEWHVFPIIANVIKDSSVRKKAFLIAKDIELLEIYSKPNHTFIDDQYNKQLNFNLGIMYVTEGSTLGGLYICKNLQQVIEPNIPQTFLTAYGEQTGKRWSDFLKMLEDHLITLDDVQKDEIIAGAVYAFGRTQELFNNDFYKNGI